MTYRAFIRWAAFYANALSGGCHLATREYGWLAGNIFVSAFIFYIIKVDP